MFKHANTIFPGDSAEERHHPGMKLSQSPRRGTVVDVDTSAGRVKVSWRTGDQEWMGMDDVEITPSGPRMNGAGDDNA